ncbi:MAG TPA: hypothetical protein VMT20_20860 [Terriglobia bacterium]|nr:hypothetical protein [Terriglobia bacterium]
MLSRNPELPGLNLEKLHGKADGLWSLRIDEKYRMILRRSQGLATLLFVGVEEDAYLLVAERLPKQAPHALAPSAPLLPRSPVPHVSPAEARTVSQTKSRTGKYVPLARHLLSSALTTNRVTLSFRRIEEILQADLPLAATRHRAWWGNDTSGHVQAVAWLSVGWRVAEVSLTDEAVSFELEQ